MATGRSDADAISEARDIVADGWCKGALHKDGAGNPTEPFAASRETSCLLGAIELVAEDQEQHVRLQQKVKKGILRSQGHDPDRSNMLSIPGFNDDKDTTHEDVILALKFAEEEK